MHRVRNRSKELAKFRFLSHIIGFEFYKLLLSRCILSISQTRLQCRQILLILLELKKSKEKSKVNHNTQSRKSLLFEFHRPIESHSLTLQIKNY